MTLVTIHEGRIISPYKQTSISGKFVLTKPEKKVTNPQRKYYWGVLVKMVSDYTGYTKKEVHGKFGWLTRKEVSTGIPRIKSLTELTTKEMEERNEEIRMYFAEKISLSIPLPNEIDYNQIEV